MWEFGGRTGEVGWGCGVWGRVERGGLRWVGIELRWRDWDWGRQGLRRWGLRGGVERWVGFREDWKRWVEVGGVRFGEAGLR